MLLTFAILNFGAGANRAGTEFCATVHGASRSPDLQRKPDNRVAGAFVS